jgi:hypothetical protein
MVSPVWIICAGMRSTKAMVFLHRWRRTANNMERIRKWFWVTRFTGAVTTAAT